MLKSRTGTDRSDHTTTWARAAVAEALLIENRVVTPLGVVRSTSKYGSSSVAAGTSSMVQITASAWPPRARRPRRARHSAVFFMTDNLLELVFPKLKLLKTSGYLRLHSPRKEITSYSKSRVRRTL